MTPTCVEVVIYKDKSLSIVRLDAATFPKLCSAAEVGLIQTFFVGSVVSGVQLSGQVVVMAGYRVVLFELLIVHPINASNKIRHNDAAPKTIK